jgi:thioredoxin reductase (NADPH)
VRDKINQTVILQLYGRTYCHLCTELLEALSPKLSGLPVSVEWIDLDEHEEWEDLYGEHIPVLKCGDIEICRHRLDEAALGAFLLRLS